MRVAKKLGKLVLYIIAIPVLYIIMSILLSWITVNDNQIEASENHEVFLSTNGVHLDIILPIDVVSEELKSGLKISDKSKYLAFGWGDENFYLNTPTWGDLTFKNAFSAAFLDSSTLMHLTEIKYKNKDWALVKINSNQLKNLNSYISNSFDYDSTGHKILLENKGYGNYDNFYKAKGSYSCFKTCNSWVNSAFKESQLKACMKTIHIFLIFIALVVVQLFVPAQMIFSKETIIENGELYKFKTRPIDPADPFRGKYITLQYDINRVKTDDTLWQRKDKAYLYVTKDANGFAQPEKISREKLDLDDDYVVVEARWYNKKNKEVTISLPFNRYYMEESKAYDAEVAHQKAQRDSLPDNTYALVYISDGEAVLSDVLIDDISIKDHVENNRLKKGEKP